MCAAWEQGGVFRKACIEPLITDTHTMRDQYGIVVIGSGPAGQKAAIQGAKAGKRVAVIERETGVGGGCVYRGTIPSKTLRESALHINRLRRASEAFEFRIREGVDQALAMLLRTLKAPIQKFVGTLAATPSKLVRTVAAVRDAKQAAA